MEVLRQEEGIKGTRCSPRGIMHSGLSKQQQPFRNFDRSAYDLAQDSEQSDDEPGEPEESCEDVGEDGPEEVDGGGRSSERGPQSEEVLFDCSQLCTRNVSVNARDELGRVGRTSWKLVASIDF
jgi:hypothetical protein